MFWKARMSEEGNRVQQSVGIALDFLEGRGVQIDCTRNDTGEIRRRTRADIVQIESEAPVQPRNGA
jgi:hypothetical protein